ncbi:MAG: AAA family ATPase [Lachnospiraceae bacterium]|nr:AAA family ATPase [Lachnospiraceae bacterium]
MKIRELRIGHFGKFHNITVRLDDGLNLIYGGNESGKSTLHAFIGAMLFGLDRSRGRAGRDDPYMRYSPWDTPGAYQGSMDFEHEGHEYRITRVFYQKEKSCVLTDLDTGRKIPLADDSITSLFPKLTRTAYYNTVSMGQTELRCSGDFGAEVRNHIANLATTGGCKLNVEGAIESLEARKKALAGELKNPASEALKAREAELLAKEKEADVLIRRRNESLESAKPLRNEIERLKSGIPDTAGLRAEWEHARTDEERAREALAAAERVLREREAAGEAETERKKEQEKELAGQRAAKRKKLAGVGLGLLAAGGLLCVAGNGRYAVLIGAGVVLLMASLVVLLAAYFAGREATVADGKQEHEDNPDGSGYVNTADAAPEAEYERAREACRAAGECVTAAADRLEAALAERERINSRIPELDESADAFESTADRCEWELENLGDIGDELDNCRHAMAEARQKEESLSRELEAASLAADAVREISEGLRDSFGSSFNELLSEEICLTTDGRYSAGRVDESLNIEVMSGLDYVPVSALSTGTMQQLYLALRFASARLFFGDEKVPVLLDESFAYSDPQRMRSALSAIADREGQQVILFTCRPDEKEILDELGAAYNLIELAG